MTSVIFKCDSATRTLQTSLMMYPELTIVFEQLFNLFGKGLCECIDELNVEKYCLNKFIDRQKITTYKWRMRDLYGTDTITIVDINDFVLAKLIFSG